jgi:hypothetical protein
LATFRGAGDGVRDLLRHTLDYGSVAMNTEVDEALAAIAKATGAADAVLLLNISHRLLIEAMQSAYPFSSDQVARLDEIQSKLWKIFDGTD